MSGTTPELDRLTQFVGTVRKALALGDDADEAAITAALGTRLGDANAAIERAKTIEQTWASEKTDAALLAAFDKSGARPEHKDDFLLLARGVFTLKDGKVITREGAANTVPGMDPAQWIQAQLKTVRGFWWPGSQGGGARGGGIGTNPNGNTDCFKPGPTFSITGQLAYIASHGEAAAQRAAAQYGGKLPGGGR